MQYFVPDDAKLHFEEDGHCYPIIFLFESSAMDLQLLAGNYRCLTYNARGFPPSNVHEERRRHKAPIVHSRGDEGVACTSASTFVLGEDALINEVLNVAQGRVGRALLNCSPFARCQLALETVQRTIQHVALPIIDLCSGKPFPELRLFKHGCENGL
jgi:hypothetical protein